MARQVLRCLASLAAMQAAASPNSVLDASEERQLKERALSVVETVSAASSEARGLSNDLCYWNLLNVFENAAMTRWQKCANQKATQKNMNVAGAIAEVNVECWCEENMAETLSPYGCCNSVYKDYCQAICPPLLDNCTTAEAQKCIQECPATCYEKDYAPSFCDTGCVGCEPYVLCITNHSKLQTSIGNAPNVCHDNAFYGSQEWKDWFDCYSAYPKRTHWARHNAENFCYCNSSLKAAAQREHCCTADWGKTICDEDCSNALANVDCNSQAAQTCLNDCKQTCHNIYKSSMTNDCKNQCMEKSSTCEKYRVCEPAGPFTFDYVCDDGTLPNKRGCCRGPLGNPTCPRLCTSATGHYPTLIAVNMLFTNANMECWCQGCPSNTDQTKTKYKETLDENLFETGTLEIARIARELGLTGPNKGMQELLQERDQRIKKMFDALPGLPDENWQTRMDAVIAEYGPKFRQEAERYKREGDTTPAPVEVPVPVPVPSPSPKESDSKTVIIIVAGGAVIAIIIAVAVVCCIKARRKVIIAGQRPIDGDTNVVMGRPVAPGASTAAAEGAPVVMDDNKGVGGDNTKLDI